MKPIELLGTQKDKLREMCRNFFSDYRWYFNEEENILEMFSGMNDTEIYEDEIPIEKFHWFEFCITTLANKIYDLQYSLEVQADILAEDYYKMIMNNHPIDYLYEQFKQLK